MTERYSPARQILHWVTVVLMFAILPVAWVVMALKEDTPAFYFYLDIHKTIGLTILALTLVRIAWRLLERAPAYDRSLPVWTRVLAAAVTGALLVMMLAMPVSGYVWTTGHGYDVAPFDLIRLPRLFWKNRALGDAAKAVHTYGQWLVYGLIALHLAGVGWHLIVRRDGLLARMLPPQALCPGDA